MSATGRPISALRTQPPTKSAWCPAVDKQAQTAWVAGAASQAAAMRITAACIRSDERLQHPRRRAPDVVRAVGDDVVVPQLPLPDAAMHLEVGRVEREAERHLEDLVDLGAVDPRHEAGVDEPDEGRHGEAGHRLVPVEARPSTSTSAGRSPISSRASRSAAASGVASLGVLLAAREGDLAGMVLEQRRPAGQDQPQAAAALDQRHQHRGRAQRAAARDGATSGLRSKSDEPPGGRRKRAPVDPREVDAVAIHARLHGAAVAAMRT